VAGAKGKVGQAMSYGLPVVTTTIGAEGMGIVDGLHALVRDDSDGFAAAVVALLSSSEMWSRISANSVELIHQFSPEAMGGRLQDMLRIALSREVGNSGARP
jgi:O-antigen biosynthesis protein